MRKNETIYVYDAFGKRAAEYDTGTVAIAPYQTCYSSADYLGSTRLVTDGTGQAIARHDYLLSGGKVSANGAGCNGPWGAGADNIAQKFTGKQRDQESGLDDFGARYYGSALGRFTSPDEPFADQDEEDPQSWNLYSYGRNNPLRFVDPDGHAAASVDDPCHGNPNCVTVTTKAPDLSAEDNLLYRYLFNVMQPSLQMHEVGQRVLRWLSQPRNGTCLSASMAAGASAGAGVGMFGLAGGPVLGVTEPTAMVIGGGLGWAGGMVSCMSSSGISGGGSGGVGGATGGGGASAIDNKKADDLIRGRLKASKSYHAEDGNKTYGEIKNLAKQGDRSAQQMKKLIEQGDRLMQKLGGK